MEWGQHKARWAAHPQHWRCMTPRGRKCLRATPNPGGHWTAPRLPPAGSREGPEAGFPSCLPFRIPLAELGRRAVLPGASTLWAPVPPGLPSSRAEHPVKRTVIATCRPLRLVIPGEQRGAEPLPAPPWSSSAGLVGALSAFAGLPLPSSPCSLGSWELPIRGAIAPGPCFP